MGLLILLTLAAAITCLIAAVATIHHLRHPHRRTYASALALGLPTDPQQLGMAFQELSFTLSDGSRTPGWRVAGRSLHGPRVLVLHDLGDSRYGVLPRVVPLLSHAREMILFDLPGQGESQARVCTLGGREPADAAAVLDQVDDANALPPVVLFAHGLGGLIALAAAERMEHRVAGVILASPWCNWREPTRSVLRRHRFPEQPTLMLAGVMMRLFMPTAARLDAVRLASQLRLPLLITGHAPGACDAAKAIISAAPHAQFIAHPSPDDLKAWFDQL